MESEDKLFSLGPALVPTFLIEVDAANLLHLFDELVDLKALRYVEEEVELVTPRNLHPGFTVLGLDGFDDVVLLDPPDVRD